MNNDFHTDKGMAELRAFLYACIDSVHVSPLVDRNTAIKMIVAEVIKILSAQNSLPNQVNYGYMLQGFSVKPSSVLTWEGLGAAFSSRKNPCLSMIVGLAVLLDQIGEIAGTTRYVGRRSWPVYYRDYVENWDKVDTDWTTPDGVLLTSGMLDAALFEIIDKAIDLHFPK